MFSTRLCIDHWKQEEREVSLLSFLIISIRHKEWESNITKKKKSTLLHIRSCNVWMQYTLRFISFYDTLNDSWIFVLQIYIDVKSRNLMKKWSRFRKNMFASSLECWLQILRQLLSLTRQQLISWINICNSLLRLPWNG